jgi:hypothetical protein
MLKAEWRRRAQIAKASKKSSNSSTSLRTNPLQELPRRHRGNAADGTAEIARDFSGENPLPKEPDEVACQQHHGEGDQQSLPKWHGHLPWSFRHGALVAFMTGMRG